ncbi:MAG: hypothetical protein ACJ0KI_00635 [Dehalococcoidia bacterium]|nr:hypothetical protein [Chloroflexota bacterium]|tara:strand:- start:344 stop:1003 length:660 start_codon:yes stop_codon:yes gene_type:complete
MAPKKGSGLMLVFVDVPSEHEEEFNEWYNTEHLQELMSVPGILNCARYEAVKSGPKHLAVYEFENAQVIDTDAFKNRPITPWAQKVGPRAIATTRINNVYEMIHPASVSDIIANSEMAPALQIGRMGVSSENEKEWNDWYSTVYVPNYETVPGVIRGRRWKAYRGEPDYAVMYEFENEFVSETKEWEDVRDAHPDTARIRPMMTHADLSPGIWKKTFQL